MSIESLMDTIEAAVIESELEDIPDFEDSEEPEEDTYISLSTEVTTPVVGAPEGTVKVKVAKKSKGRPQVHTKAGRVYFLKSEIDEIRRDPQAFIEWMKETYAVDEIRSQEIANQTLVTKPNQISFTLFGPIAEVLEQSERICALYPERDITYAISKKKLVAPTNKDYYASPKVELVKIKGKDYESITFQEFCDSVIYVYLTVD